MSEPLKPCPFEHTGAELVCTGDGIQSWMACRICGTLGPIAHTEAKAIAAWNRRAPAALPTREEVAEAIWRAWSPQCDRCDVLRGCGCSQGAADAVLALMGKKEAGG